MCIRFCRILPAIVLALPAGAYAMEADIIYGVHDFVVSEISSNSLYDGENSHTRGIDVGATIEHVLEPNIVLGGNVDIFIDHDKDHLDPDHDPIWHRFQFYADGTIAKLTENTGFMWHLDYRNKQNTASGIEREIKEFYGLGLDYNNDVFHLALNGYSGFFYLEIDDDAPRQYAGYDREDLDDGTSAVSIRLDGSVKLSENILFSSHVQNWTSLGVGSGWLENEVVAEIKYKTNDWMQGSRLHFRITYTHYNFDGYYRSDLGMPVLPWDNDTLLRAYMSVPW